VGLSYLRSNPFGSDDGSGLDDPSADSSGPVDLSALLSPELYARRMALPGGGGPPPAPPSPPAPPTFGAPGPQGLFPAQPHLTATAPGDDQDPNAPPGNDLLSRFASRLGGFGTATTEEDRRQALRQAMVQAGLTMASNAGTHGYGAIAPALLGGFATYRGGVEQAAAGREHAAQVQAAEDDRKARLAMDKGRYQDEAQLRQDALQDRRDQAQAKVDQRQSRLDQHQAMLKIIGETDPKLAAKLAPLAGSDTAAIETAYTASLKPEKPASPKGSIQVVGRTALYLDPDDPMHPKPVYTAPRDIDPVVAAMRVDQQDRLKQDAVATEANRIFHSGIDYINGHNAQVRRAKADLRAGFQVGTIPDQKAYRAALAQIPNEIEIPAGAYDSALAQARAVAEARAAAKGQGTAGGSPVPAPAAPAKAARPSLAEARPTILTRLRQRMPGATEDQIQAALAKALAAYGGQ
jgi:hypothetical protein